MIPYALEGMPLVRRPVATVVLIVVRALVVATGVAASHGPLGVVLAPFVYRDAWELVVVSVLVALAAASIENRWGALALLGLDVVGGLLTVAVLPFVSPGTPLAGAAGSAAVVVGAFAVLFGDARMKLGVFSWFGAGKWRVPAWTLAPLLLAGQIVTRGGTFVLLPTLAGLALGAGVAFFARRAGVDGQLTTRAAAAPGGPIDAAREEALRELAKLPGGSPDRPIEVSTAAVVDARAKSLACPACGETAMVVEHHRATEHGGRLLREVRTRCRQCGAERIVWLAVAAGRQ